MENFKLVCPCILGVEGLVADELRAMEAKNVEPQNGRVVFDGDINMLVRANLCSRYSERVLILLGTFQARSFEELFQGVKALPWETWIGQNDIFPVKGRSLSSQLSSVPDCQKNHKKGCGGAPETKISCFMVQRNRYVISNSIFNYERPSQHYDRYFRCRAA